MTIPTVEATGPYLLDPTTEDLLLGEDLREGMIVLIEQSTLRWDIMTRRWCQITRLRKTSEHVDFIGVYADGSKASKHYHLSFCWFVKLDSIAASGPA